MAKAGLEGIYADTKGAWSGSTPWRPAALSDIFLRSSCCPGLPLSDQHDHGWFFTRCHSLVPASWSGVSIGAQEQRLSGLLAAWRKLSRAEERCDPKAQTGPGHYPPSYSTLLQEPGILCGTNLFLAPLLTRLYRMGAQNNGLSSWVRTTTWGFQRWLIQP